MARDLLGSAGLLTLAFAAALLAIWAGLAGGN